MKWRARRQWLGYRMRTALFILAVVFLLPLGACTSSPPPPALCGPGGEAGPPVVMYTEPVTAPAVADGAVYIGNKISTDDGYGLQSFIAAFRASDGALLWRLPEPIEAAGMVANKDVLILSSAAALAALRTSDGALLWRLPWGSLVGLIPWTSNGNDLSYGPQIILDAGVLFAIDYSGSEAYAVRVADGQVLWQVSLPNDGAAVPLPPNTVYPHRFGPVVSGGTVFIGSLNDSIIAIRAADGTVLWQRVVASPTPLTSGAVQSQPPQVHPLAATYDALYVAAGDEIVRLRSGDGTVEQRIRPSPGMLPADVDPVVINGTAYLGVIGNDSTYTLLGANGQRIWQAHLTAYAGNIVAQDHGILFLRGGYFYAIRLADGAVLWSARFYLPLANIVVAGQVYVSASGERDRCHNSKNQIAPEVVAVNENTGNTSWRLDLDRAS